MSSPIEIAAARRSYAERILVPFGVQNPRLEAAFAEVPREDFLGPGPWQIFCGRGMYAPTTTADPICLYTDDLVGIVPERGINNGQPSLHAGLLDCAAIQAGEHVVHIGTGTGYYTAVMARLAGPMGSVTGIEFDPELAARARGNLASFGNINVRTGNGASIAFSPADVIYVNAGMTRPVNAWLDGLTGGGRLILPLTTDASASRDVLQGALDLKQMARRGAVFRIARRGPHYDARWICPAAYILAEGIRDPASETALAAALARGDWQRVTRLYRGEALVQNCWLQGDGWCLA